MRYRNRLPEIGIEKKCKRAQIQSNYRSNRGRRLSIGFRQHLNADVEETQAPILSD